MLQVGNILRPVSSRKAGFHACRGSNTGCGIAFAFEPRRLRARHSRRLLFVIPGHLMHVRELAQFAGLVALNGPQFVATKPCDNCVRVEQYWAASKCRFEAWARALKVSRSDSGDERNPADHWIVLRGTLDEIFVSDLLTRVWTALVAARDQRWSTDSCDTVTRNVFSAQLDARHRALELLLDRNAMTARQALAIDRVRRKAERWTDALLGALAGVCDFREFAIDQDRAGEFAVDLARHRGDGMHEAFWRLLMLSLSSAFRRGVSPTAANPDANARITANILGSFRAELFDSTGLYHSLWMVRLSAVASDAQGMIRDLLGTGRIADSSADSKKPSRRRI
jgi:hypothetical protein